MTNASDPLPTDYSRITKLIVGCNDAQVAQRDVLLALTQSGDHDEDWEDFRPTLRLLLGYILERGFAALRLITMRHDFDAEILLRTFHEGAAKLMLIALTPEADRAKVLGEYWSGLGEVADRKTAHRAGLAEAVMPEGGDGSRDSLRVLQVRRSQRGEQTLDRNERRRLEQRWSLPEVLTALDRLLRTERPEAVALLHIYGMASHLAHADSRALELRLDRSFRPPKERADLEDAHCARMLSDIAVVGAFCTLLTAEAAGGVRDDLEPAMAKAAKVGADAAVIMGEFDATQREFNRSILADEVRN
ncbi:MAG: hypothetical protein V4820_07830 [Pseudomonadota bacterium]